MGLLEDSSERLIPLPVAENACKKEKTKRYGQRRPKTNYSSPSPSAARESRSVIFSTAKPPRQAFPRLFRATLTRHFPFYSEESFVSRKPLSKDSRRNTYYAMWPRRPVKSRGKVNISSLWNFANFVNPLSFFGWTLDWKFDAYFVVQSRS